MSVVNISCYKFVTLTDREALKADLTARCLALGLKGTILLAPEGINVFLAGSREAIDAIVAHLRADPRFADLAPKESLSAEPPFHRMRVRLKQEIITMKMPLIRPEAGRAPSVDCRHAEAVAGSRLRRRRASGGDARHAQRLRGRSRHLRQRRRLRTSASSANSRRSSPRTATTSQARPSSRSAPAASAAKRPPST